jgi:hypothetical protein
VSADIEREQQQNSAQPAQAYYTVRVSLPADEVARLTDIHRGLAVGFVGASEGVGRPETYC